MKAYRLLTFSAAVLLTGLMVFAVSSQTSRIPAQRDMSTPILATVIVTAHTRHS